jgi:two-component system, NarL family, sensor histidine kinase UhpB
MWNRRCDGQVFAEWLCITAVLSDDGSVSHYVGAFFDITESRRREQQMRDLSAHLQTVREEEKAHFARELHDDLGGTLAALKLDAYWLVQNLQKDKQHAVMLERAQAIYGQLESTVKSVRGIITDLRPPLLDDFGLLAAIEWQANQFQKRTGIECRVSCGGHYDCEDQIAPAHAINLFRIFQESLNNVLRHSGASRVEVELRQSRQALTLSIRDNGRGLAVGHTIAQTSYGVRGMRERVLHMGGSFKIVSQPGLGLSVRVRLKLPIVSKDEAGEERAVPNPSGHRPG